jgi:hypothetical protein
LVVCGCDFYGTCSKPHLDEVISNDCHLPDGWVNIRRRIKQWQLTVLE